MRTIHSSYALLLPHPSKANQRPAEEGFSSSTFLTVLLCRRWLGLRGKGVTRDIEFPQPIHSAGVQLHNHLPLLWILDSCVCHNNNNSSVGVTSHRTNESKIHSLISLSLPLIGLNTLCQCASRFIHSQ